MQTTSILPNYFQAINYALPTAGSSNIIVPRDRRRTYLRVIFGFAGIGVNAGIFLDGTGPQNKFATIAGGDTFEMKWEPHNVLVQAEIWCNDIAAASFVSIWGVLCIEEQTRYGYDPRRKKPSGFENPRVIRPTQWYKPRSKPSQNPGQFVQVLTDIRHVGK